ncbi:MAG TPA: SDR family NAD(P)-dependent oxidoreductase [Polyangiales bacterium]
MHPTAVLFTTRTATKTPIAMKTQKKRSPRTGGAAAIMKARLTAVRADTMTTTMDGPTAAAGTVVAGTAAAGMGMGMGTARARRSRSPSTAARVDGLIARPNQRAHGKTADMSGAVLITGAFGNMGKAIASALAPTTPLALITHGEARPHGLPEGARVSVIEHVNLADEASTRMAVERARRELGPITGLVHTVGAYADGMPVESAPLSKVRELLETNYLASLAMIQAVLPELAAAGGGRIVMFGSVDAFKARAGASAYAASKAALVRFAEGLAQEVAASDIGVCVLIPTTIDTPTNRAAMPDARFSDWVPMEDIASVVTFLLSPASRAIRFAALPLGL